MATGVIKHMSYFLSFDRRSCVAAATIRGKTMSAGEIFMVELAMPAGGCGVGNAFRGDDRRTRACVGDGLRARRGVRDAPRREATPGSLSRARDLVVERKDRSGVGRRRTGCAARAAGRPGRRWPYAGSARPPDGERGRGTARREAIRRARRSRLIRSSPGRQVSLGRTVASARVFWRGMKREKVLVTMSGRGAAL